MTWKPDIGTLTDAQLADELRGLFEQERATVDARRAVEDEIVRRANIDLTKEGTVRLKNGLKCVRKINTRIDVSALQEAAKDNGVEKHLGILFRWKPSVSKRAWDAASEELRGVFAKAITRQPGRPSFEFVDKKEEGN